MQHTLLYIIEQSRRRISSLAIVSMMSLLPLSVNAQNVFEMFKSMPDTLLPYLHADARKTLAENAKESLQTDISGKTVFDSDATLTALSSSRLKLAIDSTVTVEMMMLPVSGSDSLCCMIRTLQLPQHDSDITLFDRHWNSVGTIDFKGEDLKTTCRSFTAKPDTMTQSRYDELLTKIAFLTVEAKTVSDTEIQLIPSAPLLFKDDETPVKSILLQRNVKWNGQTFK